MRLFYFICSTLSIFLFPWWVTLPVWVWYAFRYRAYELVCVGILFDGYIGYTFPWHLLYTLSALFICICAEFLKPRIAFGGSRV